MKKRGGSAVRWVCAWAVSGAIAAQAATGVWSNVSGGYWADGANWQDSVVPSSAGSEPGSGDVADFTALAAGETVTVTNYTGSGALRFAGLAGDFWTVTGGSLGLANAPDFLAERYGEIRVDGGELNLVAPVNNGGYGVAKTGTGTLRLSSTHTYTGFTHLKAGRLALTNGAGLAVSAVIVDAPDAALQLEGDAQIGSIESRCVPQTTVDLGGHTLSIGGVGSARAFDGCFSNGALRFTRGDALVVTDTQNVTAVRLENGSLACGVGVTVAGWWRFDDAAQAGKDAGPRANHLVESGTQTQWLANDSERGSVLALEGAGTWLAGPNGGEIEGLPVSNMSFTVAFWVKPDSDVKLTAGLFAWGVPNQDRRYNMLRLNTPASDKPLMHTNWGNNREIPYAPGLMDGAWHHVAIVYRDGFYLYYIDGEPVGADSSTVPLQVAAGNFTLGKGFSSDTFKGLIDDLLIAQGALSYGQLRALRLNGEVPAEKAPENVLPAMADVEIAYNGTLSLAGDQTLDTLGGAGAVGGVALQGGAALTVTGSGRLDGAVSGAGRLVKRGAASTLTLGGRVDATGAVEIAEGTLALAGRTPDGLQAYYRFDDAAVLGKDSSGNGYDLAASNAPAFAPGLFNGAASFTAADKTHFYAPVFPATLPTGNASYTVAAWCNLKAGGNTLGLPVYWGYGNNFVNSSVLFRFNSTTNIMTSNMGNNWTVNAGYDLASDTPDGGWHHIVCTYDAAQRVQRVYFNGNLSQTRTITSDLTVVGNLFWLGGAPYSSANFFDGLLDEVMIFNRALDNNEVSDVATGVFSAPWGSRLADRVVARYDFEDAANLGRDSGPYGYHLSRTGSVASAAGKVGQAMSLNIWSQGYLTWTNSVFPEALPTGNAPVTVTAWVNPATNPNKEGSMVFWGTTLNGRKGCHLLRLAGNTAGQVVFRLVDGVEYLGDDTLVSFERGDREEGWHHLAAVVGPGGLRSFYVDGALVARNRVSGQTVDPGTFSIGYKPNAPTAWFQGMIDDVTIYDCALSRTEILETLRGRPDVLPPERAAEVAAGAVLDVGTAAQRVSGLSGAGEVRVATGGELTIAGGTATFDGALTGAGAIAVRDGAVQTLAGAGTFSGTLSVSNATLKVENASGLATGTGAAVAVLAGGVIGGAGALAGVVVLENGAVIAGGDALTVDGSVTLAANGTVSLPQGFTTGSLTLFNATAVTAPDGVAGWQIEPAQPSLAVEFHASGTTFSVSVFRQGTLFSIQ